MRLLITKQTTALKRQVREGEVIEVSGAEARVLMAANKARPAPAGSQSQPAPAKSTRKARA